MTISEKIRKPLFTTLEARGWWWEGEHLYAPRRSFAIERHQERELPLFQLIEVHEKMSQRLEELKEGKAELKSSPKDEDYFCDLEELVDALSELIRKDESGS
jgi:hypothetical protein